MKLAYIIDDIEYLKDADEVIILTDEGAPVVVVTKKVRGVYDVATVQDTDFDRVLKSLSIDLKIIHIND